MLTQVDLEEMRKVFREELKINVGRFTKDDVHLLEGLALEYAYSTNDDLKDLASRIQDLL